MNLLLFFGFLTKLECQGRLLVSAVGNPTLVQLDPLPKELGCAVLLKPLKESGRTNIFIETSSGSFEGFIQIDKSGTRSSRSMVIPINTQRGTK